MATITNNKIATGVVLSFASNMGMCKKNGYSIQVALLDGFPGWLGDGGHHRDVIEAKEVKWISLRLGGL